MPYTIEAITTATHEGLVRLIHQDGQLVGRVLDKTPYVPARADGDMHGVRVGTSPDLYAFEAQFWQDGQWQEGPTFRRLEQAWEWITELPWHPSFARHDPPSEKIRATFTAAGSAPSRRRKRR